MTKFKYLDVVNVLSGFYRTQYGSVIKIHQDPEGATQTVMNPDTGDVTTVKVPLVLYNVKLKVDDAEVWIEEKDLEAANV